MNGRPKRWIAFALGAVTLGNLASAGCSIAPKSFVAANDPAPLVRARALGMGDGRSNSEVVPTLIGKLNDPDGVVRMTAIEELKRRTGQDLGYVPWAGQEDRTRSIAAWQSWWQGQQGRVYASTQQQPQPPTRQLTAAEYRRLKRGRR